MDPFTPYDSSYYSYEDPYESDWGPGWDWLWEPWYGYIPPELPEDPLPLTEEEMDYYFDEE